MELSGDILKITIPVLLVLLTAWLLELLVAGCWLLVRETTRNKEQATSNKQQITFIVTRHYVLQMC